MDATSSSRSSTAPSERRLALARVLSVKGLRGGVRVEVLTDWPERIEPGTSVYLEGTADMLTVSHAEQGGRVPVLYFEGRDSRESVEPLVGRFLEGVARPLDEGSYYWGDLIGLRVEEPDGTLVGDLVEVFRAGGNEVYRVVGPGGERLVPALRSAVRHIDLDAQLMVVAPDDAESIR